MALGQVGAGPQNLLDALTPSVLCTGILDGHVLAAISVWAHPWERIRVRQALMGRPGRVNSRSIPVGNFSRFSKECGAQSGAPLGVSW